MPLLHPTPRALLPKITSLLYVEHAFGKICNIFSFPNDQDRSFYFSSLNNFVAYNLRKPKK
jgi:hypothetical protein